MLVVGILILAMFVLGMLSNKVMAATGKINVEVPRQNEQVQGEVNINGWAMSDDRNSYLQILLDGRIIGTPNRYEREDVLRAVHGFGGRTTNRKPGFEYRLNVSNIEDGIHVVAVRIVSSQNRVLTIEDKIFYVKKYDCRLAVEIPEEGQEVKTNVKINGWALSTDKNDKVVVKLDGKIMGEAKRYVRTDVFRVFSGYGGKETNANPGYDLDLNTANLPDGLHTITVELRASNGELMTSGQKTIRVAKSYQTLLNLELPRENATAKTSVKVNGWMMSEDKEAVIEVLLDNKKVSEKVERYIRADVLYTIKGYGGVLTNKTPGFNIDINTTKILDGRHTITVNVRTKAGELLATASKKFDIHKYEGRMNLEQPEENRTCTNKLIIQGWTLSEDKNDNVTIYVDHKKYMDATRYVRNDVFRVIQGYGGKEANPNPGFEAQIDATKLSEGKHTITVKIETSTGEVIQQNSRTIIVSRNFATRMNLELPKEQSLLKKEIKVDGWVVSEDEKATLEVLVDGTKIKETVNRYARNDLENIVSSYGGKESNPTEGFISTIDATTLKDGNHTITARLISRFGKVLAQQSRIIKIHKYDARLAIEQPISNKIVKTSMKVNGWALSEDKNDSIEVRLDNKVIAKATRYVRDDVFNVIKDCGGKEMNPSPGYDLDLDLSNVKDGNHTVTVNIIASKTGEIIGSASTKVQVRKYEGKIHIETPIDNKNVKEDTLEVSGWEMSETIATVKLYVDGRDYSHLVTRSERGDVIGAISGYGGIQVNPTPGFSAIVPVKNLAPGSHTITIKTFSSLGDELAGLSQRFYFFPSALLGMDVSQHNGMINWDLVKESKIDFAIIRCGYGRNVEEQDDEMFQRNLEECERIGIPYGVYLYSYAGDREGARSEAEHVLRLIGNKKPVCGIWIDIEDADGYKVENGIPYESGVEVADEFCSIMKAKGYQTGIYASLSWLNGPLKNPLLDQYDKWVAQWNHVCEYGGSYVMWQYTSSGAVAGITGNVDMNLWYKKRG